MPHVMVPSGKLWYEREGHGRPLLLVTGLSGGAGYWAPQKSLAAYFDLVTYDHIGVGRSDRPDDGYSIEGMARDALALLDELKIEQADIVGHSAGGCIAQVLASRHPDRIRKVIAASSWMQADWRFEKFFRQRQTTLACSGLEAYSGWSVLTNYPPDWAIENRPYLEARELAGLAASTPSIMSQRIEALLAFDGAQYATNISTPFSLACARDDQVTPEHMSINLARALPRASFECFAHGGHCFTQVQPTAFNAFVLRELA